MKKIRLNSLHSENFMGIRNLKFSPMGKNATLRGDNGTFKTTNASGFSWLLFDKDVHGNSTGNFSIKTTDENDKVIPNLDHSEIGVLDIDGTPLTLQKIYREKWLKKRKVLTGHTTEYLIDDVPVKKKEYDAKIAEIIPENLFRLLTSITYFNEMKWEARRKILFQLCAGLTEDTLEDAEKKKKILASKKKRINEQKDEIRPRIDELHRGIVAIADYDQTEINARIAGLESQIQTIKTDSSRAALLKEQAELEARLSRFKADQATDRLTATEGIRIEIEGLAEDSRVAKRAIREFEDDIEDRNGIIEITEEEIERLYQDWDKLEKAQPETNNICPTCHNPLRPEQIESAKEEFNLQLSKGKEAINDLGKKTRSKKDQAETEKIRLCVELKKEQLELAELEKTLDKKKTELDGILSPAERPKGDAEKVKIQERIAKIEGLLQQDDQEQNTALLEVDLKAERAKLAEIDAAIKSNARIIELGEQEKTLSAEVEKLEGELFHAEQSIQNQARLLEDEINNKFKLVKFQLFETQMNEGVRPTCVTLIDGIPYGHGLNKGNMINAGLDIIKTLSEHYQIKCPVFIDDCSLISRPIDPGCQHFKLINVKDMNPMEITYEK